MDPFALFDWGVPNKLFLVWVFTGFLVFWVGFPNKFVLDKGFFFCAGFVSLDWLGLGFPKRFVLVAFGFGAFPNKLFLVDWEILVLLGLFDNFSILILMYLIYVLCFLYLIYLKNCFLDLLN